MAFTHIVKLLASILLLGFASLAKADGKYLKTNSLLTCMENSEFSSTYFSVTYYPSNNSIYYEIDGSSLITGKIKATYSIIVYGLDVYDGELNLCDFNIKTICPISAGHVDISGTYKISSSQVSSIPSIAYTVPDLDAYVQVHVYSTDDSDSKTMLACMQATLSNGRTVQTRYAGWPIACISGFGLAISSFVSLFGHSATASHIASNAASLFIYFQTLAIHAMMGVAKVPPIAAAWAQNFMWTLGIIRAGFMQQMLYWYIQATGGSVTSILTNQSVISISVQRKFSHILHSLFKRAVSVASGSTIDVLDQTSLYTTNEDDVGSKILVLRGIQRVAYLAGIEISNIFMTSIIFFLFVGFVLIVFVTLFKGAVEVLVRSGALNPGKLSAFRSHWVSIIKGLLYRLMNITFSQISLMCIFEFTRHDSAGCVVFAVVIGLVVWVLMCYSAIRILLTGRRSIHQHSNPAYLLFGDAKFLSKYGFLYTQYKAGKFYWTPISMDHGKICACMIFAIEFLYMLALIWKRPFMDKRTNLFNIFIAIVNFINSIFFMFYSNVFNQPSVVSSVAAIVYFVLNAVVALITLIMTIVTCTLALVHRNPDSRYAPYQDDRAAFIPKSDNRKSQAEYELEALGAAAMRGHNRDSMLPDNDAEIKFDTTNNRASGNPFNIDENDNDARYSSPVKKDAYYNGYYSNADYRGRRGAADSSASNSNEAFFQKHAMNQRNII
ncbi:hypothetical protein HII13_003893 [Brettanomyces bruxellensis]|nr:hypothetical protein HII13_003893 [Brettanomyces bruxellensis]